MKLIDAHGQPLHEGDNLKVKMTKNEALDLISQLAEELKKESDEVVFWLFDNE